MKAQSEINYQGETELAEEGFTAWCNSYEPMRFVILAGILLIQGCILIPAAFLIIFNNDLGLTEMSVGLISGFTFLVLAANLSQFPMKWVFLTFGVNLFVTLGLIIIHLIA